MPRPECPRCGSDLLVAAPSEAPSERVLVLRDGRAPVEAPGGAPHWLCRSCAYQWEPEVGDDPRPEPAVEPHGHDPHDVLRRAREAEGRSLVEASVGTKISPHHLAALESGAPLEAFPAPAYARFFLREYAEFLRLDPDPLLHEFDERHRPVEEPDLEPIPDDRRRHRLVAVVMALLSTALLAVLALLPPSAEPNRGPGVPAGADRAAPSSSPSPAVDEVAPPRTPNGVRAVLRLREPSWVQAIGDGEVLAAATLQPGEPVIYRADRLLTLTLGNAGGVVLRVNGEVVPTGTAGEVVDLELRWRDDHLVVRRA